MIIDKELESAVKQVAKLSGGYLTVALFNQNRGELPSWDTLKKGLNMEFSELLKLCGVLSKEEHLEKVNRVKAISNMKLLGLEYGGVSKSLYESQTPKLTPTAEYISKHYGWEDIVKAANVKMANNQYLSLDEMIKQLKETIKELGYVPTSSDYKQKRLKPTQESLSNMGVQWSLAMKKAGYRPYGKNVAKPDRVCKEENCYKQFTPSDQAEVYCDTCYKKLRQRVINELDNFDKTTLKEICMKLIYTGLSQKVFLQTFRDKQ